ncbi:Crp/Fnr family transcriptional regulator [Kinneretia aquatilis]|uniref:Crp/Fnr family transcriptional regulator n=1 Tax=Kinneretia aquatilis TaxID=2070761 RepID=UPI0014952D16|nr:Crp/Fnr family transcriptional regulator [Paucibacter aquatile]WIV96985.1 Crp/Fnr family transcriptional regulator [Paucibacter aquatile]
MDLVTAWTQAPFPESARALSPVVAYEFPALPVLDLCRQHPALLATLLDSLSRSACDALESRQALTTQDFPSRLAEWLLHELMLNGHGDCLTLSQFKRDLAAQLGVTPETLSRTLRQFHEQGLIVMKHSQLRFPDPARLAALSQRPASAQPASP